MILIFRRPPPVTRLAPLVVTLLLPSSAAAAVTAYPLPEGLPRSDCYGVEVVQGGATTPLVVHTRKARWRTNNSKDTSWAPFAFDGEVTIRVTRLDGPVSFCQILPSSRGIAPRITGSTVEFDLDRPGQLSVEFQRGTRIDHPLLIFADPPETDIPTPDDPDVIWFGPGLHEIGEGLPLKSGQTVYLAPGAYVKGQLAARNVRDVRVLGRGILSGEEYAARSADHMIHLQGDNLNIEGITMIEAPRFNIVLRGRDHVVRNVKMMGWWFSTDGVSTGNGSLVEDCFFKCNDDSIKLYTSGTVAQRCVIWQMENGASFQISWNTGSDQAGFVARDIDVIRVEHEWDNPNEAVFCAIHGSGGVLEDYLFEDIRIENAPWRLVHLTTRPNRFASWDPDRGSISHVVFRDVTVADEPQIPNLIKGHDEKHPVRDVLFDNLVVAGRPVTNAASGRFLIDSSTTANIRFLNTRSGPAPQP